MKFDIPAALKAEHQELHDELERAVHSGGLIGEAARAVAELMHPHFLKEEEFALPPLGLLNLLVEGKLDADMTGILTLTDKLEAELPRMIADHHEIVKALLRLIEIAKAEKRVEYERFAERLIAHAQTEEQVLYPAALLVGRYVRKGLETLARDDRGPGR